MVRKQITAGSNSRLDDFEECALRAKLKYVDRVPEPDRGAPPKGKQEWPNDRGNRVHDEAEEFVKGEREEITPELSSFRSELFQARALHSRGLVETERMWCFDENWKPVAEDDYKRTRFRIKIDLNVTVAANHQLVVDYKTGRRWGNEVKHERQKTTYGVGVFCRMPSVQLVTTELWYLDLPNEDLYATKLTRQQGRILLRALDARNRRMLQATVFPPNPSVYVCRFCPYNSANRPEGDDVGCKHAVNKRR